MHSEVSGRNPGISVVLSIKTLRGNEGRQIFTKPFQDMKGTEFIICVADDVENIPGFGSVSSVSIEFHSITRGLYLIQMGKIYNKRIRRKMVE